MDARTRGWIHALQLASVPPVLRCRVLRLLVTAVAAGARLPPARGQLLLLRLVEPLARAAHRRLDHRGLLPRPRDRRVGIPGPAEAPADDQHPLEPRPPVLLQVRQLLPRLAQNR